MKSFTKLSFIAVLGLSVFFGGSSLVQAEITTDKQQTQSTLQEADILFIEGNNSNNTELMRQAKDKYSLWLEENDKKADKKMLAEILRSRASVSTRLGDFNDAISDYKRSTQYDPSGEIQLGICFLEKAQGKEQAGLQNCYTKAVQFFADKQVTKTDASYLIARILSGDKAAITEYKNVIELTTGDEQLTYKMAAQEYFDESICKQILTKCEVE